ncbi:DUF3179 domain-containing protein [Thalassotalea sp. G2M2-11]|uniref:DUF3179 domain-containing protein n=1 Tax=Thalassotalea sp. G2M2-11 TaxID=2787627 RepID=UPI0019CFE8A5|nr:DUF3179 domain-containing protein [Thalassotalea sp. G2M2-11]
MLARLLLCTSILVITACGGGSSGSSNTNNNSSTGGNDSTEWAINTNYLMDGGPGKDGIPSLDSPQFTPAEQLNYIDSQELIIGISYQGQIKGYPHKVLDWHEIVNDSVAGNKFVLSYCPLTGSAMAWAIDSQTGDTEFGVSGLLYNSNLILYDRNTDSNWPQMLMTSANGSKSGTQANQLTTFETTWEQFKTMYPNAQVLDENQGFSRDYQAYPYGSFRTDNNLLFNVNNKDDDRLHKKERVLGINVGDEYIAIVIDLLMADHELITIEVGGEQITIAGSGDKKMAVAFHNQLSDGTMLTFTPEYGQYPIIMSDQEGNMWDINGIAHSGPRENNRLNIPFSYVAYWYAWASFFPQTSIY